jgi:hypothetical protein
MEENFRGLAEAQAPRKPNISNACARLFPLNSQSEIRI